MNVVIVGGGLAAASAVEELREQGYEGDLTLVGAEEHLPYERPPLSKGVLLGDEEPDSVFVHDRGWYDDHAVDLRLGTPATGLDLNRGTLSAGGDELAFDRLLLATGAVPRRLSMADDSGAPVAYLRTLEDSVALKDAFGAGKQIVVIGGGWIGLEVTAAARAAGSDVVLVESLDLPLLRVLGPEVAEGFAALHRGQGVDLRLGGTVSGIDRDGDGAVVRLADGSELAADLVVVGIGVEPRVELAEAAGLAVGDGVLVGPDLRASDPRVFAAGDIANHDHPVLGRRVRVEHWDTAINQGKHAARMMLGSDGVYEQLPYFFTDQYDLGMEYVGSVGPDGYSQVVLRGAPTDDTYAAFWLEGDRVAAGMHVNDWDAIDPIRSIVGGKVDPDRLGDPDVPLADVADGRG